MIFLVPRNNGLARLLLKSAGHLSKRAGRVYGGNDGLAFELRAGAEKALRTGREREAFALT